MLVSLRSHRFSVLIPLLFFLLLSPESLSAQGATGALFYYYQGSRVPLTLDPGHVSARFGAGVSESAGEQDARQAGDVEGIDPQIDTSALGVSIMTVVPGHDPQAAVARLKGSPGIRSAGRIFSFPGRVLYAETDQFLARFKPGLSQSEIVSINQSNGVETVRAEPTSPDIFLLAAKEGNRTGALELANTYVEKGWVEFAEPNFIIIRPENISSSTTNIAGSTQTPNDPLFINQWALQNTQQFANVQMVAGADINALEGWSYETGSNAVKIAIIDEGVDATHPDLLGKVLPGHNSLDRSSNAQPNPGDYHGTAAAGLAAASTNNAAGIAGVCQQCLILPVKIAYEDANHNWITSDDILVDGINWAWQNGADVLSNSWVMPGPSQTVGFAIMNANAGGRNGYGSTVVFAAGNEGNNQVDFPASLSSYVIAVAATNWCDQIKTSTSNGCNNNELWASNYGIGVAMVAPGTDLVTTCTPTSCPPNPPAAGYVYFSGTSASTPLVAGAAGLLYSHDPGLLPGDVLRMMQNGGKYLPGGLSGYRRLDLAGAIKALSDLSLGLRRDNPSPSVGDTIQYTFSYTNNGLIDDPAPQMLIGMSPGLAVISATVTLTPTSPITPTYSFYQASLPPLARNQSSSFVVAVQAQPGAETQPQEFGGQITSANPELNLNDNLAVDYLTVFRYRFFLPLILK